jgi:hypothetical protein
MLAFAQYPRRKKGDGMLVLGLSGSFSHEDVGLTPDTDARFFHDAAACFIEDGTLLAA